MVDSATARFGARKQSLGSNVNTWGDTKLNDVLDLFDRGAKGYQAIPMTGGTTLTWTTYATANQGQVQTVKLTGTLSAEANLIIPSKEWAFTVINAAGHTVTVKTSAGTGVAIPTGYQAALYCDGVDVANAAGSVIGGALRVLGAVRVDGRISNVEAAAVGTDAVNKSQMDVAIALASTSTTPGTARVSSTDTTAKFLDTALAVSGALSKTLNNPGENETLTLSVSAATTGSDGAMTAAHVKALAALGGTAITVSSGTTSGVAFQRYRMTGSATLTLPTFAADEFIVVEFAATNGTLQTIARNSQTIDGVADNDVSARYGDVVLYRCATPGAVTTQHISLLPN
ncbi:MAG: hypothetical protein JNM81_13720 [Rhodospirillaceae bacterium]|nr:hypothetical protein [Rhodospirillaceae bacterium]